MSEGPQSNRLLGQLWRAAKVAVGARELAGRPCPSTYVLQGCDAYQLANAISADSAKDSELGRTFLTESATRARRLAYRLSSTKSYDGAITRFSAAAQNALNLLFRART